jgi:hypothetical protein
MKATDQRTTQAVLAKGASTPESRLGAPANRKTKLQGNDCRNPKSYKFQTGVTINYTAISTACRYFMD